MPNKKKFGKNRKMKGGAPGDLNEPIVGRVATASDKSLPQTEAIPVAIPTKNVTGGSSYQRYSDNIYISVIMGIGIMGAVWLMISRSLIRHKYSEVVAYSLMGVAVILSLFLIIFKGVRRIKPQSGIVGAINDI